jgi:uncharacterized membrane protein
VAKRGWKGFREQKQPTVIAEREYAIQQTIEGKFYSGPLPESAELKAYAEVFAELPSRIVAMAEKEQDHRHKLQERRMGGQIWLTGAGQVFAFILAAMMIAGAVYLLATDKPIAGFTTLALGIGSAIGPFLYRKSMRRGAAATDQTIARTG